MMVYPQLFVTDDNDPQNAVRRVQQDQGTGAAGNSNFRQMQQHQQLQQQQQQQQPQQRNTFGNQQGPGMGGMGGMGAGMAGGGMMPGMGSGSMMGGMQNPGMMDMLAAMQQGGGNPGMQQGGGGGGGMPNQFGQGGGGLPNDPSLLAMQQQRILQMQAQQMQMQQQLMRLQGMNMPGAGSAGQGNTGGMDALWKAQAGAANPFFMGNAPLNQAPNEGTFMGSEMLQQVERLKRRRSSGAGGQSMGADTPPQKRPTSFMPGMMGNPFGGDMPTMDDRKPSGFGLGGLGIGQHSAPVLPTSSKKRKAKTFPVKFMQSLIEHPNEDAVAWLPDGKSFVIVQPDLFVENVLKHMFKECKYASFVRKLHRWGFVRLTSGTGTDCFHHPLFQKDRLDLCQRIVCTPREGSSASKSASAKTLQQQQRQQQQQAAQSAGVDKPPSLAGVEKFFRQKHSMDTKAAASASAPSKPAIDDSSAGGDVGDDPTGSSADI